MSFLYRAIGTTAVAAAALVGASMSANAVTITGAALSGVTLDTGPAGTSATFNSTTNQITLSSPSSTLIDPANPATYVPAFQDAASVTINNGAVFGGQTVQLGNLNSLLSAGAAGNISFNTASTNATGLAPYWQVMLTDPNVAGKTILIRAFGNGTTGASIFNQGPNVHASASVTTLGSTQTYNNSGGSFAGGGPFDGSANQNLWSNIRNVSIDGAALGTWQVASVGIADGAFQGGANTSTIDSITLTSVAAVPEPSTWAMMMLGFAGLGLLSYRRTRRKGGSNLRFA